MNSFHLGKNKRLEEERFFWRSQSCLSADPPIPRPVFCSPHPVAPPSLFSPCKSSSWKQHCLAFTSIRIEGFEDWEGFTNHWGWPAGGMTSSPVLSGTKEVLKTCTWARNVLSTLMSWLPWPRSRWWLNLFSSPQISTWISLAQSCLWHSHLANGIAGTIKSDYGLLSFSSHWTAQETNQSTAAPRWVLQMEEDNGIKRRTERMKPNIFILSVLVFVWNDLSLLFLLQSHD